MFAIMGSRDKMNWVTLAVYREYRDADSKLSEAEVRGLWPDWTHMKIIKECDLVITRRATYEKRDTTS